MSAISAAAPTRARAKDLRTAPLSATERLLQEARAFGCEAVPTKRGHFVPFFTTDADTGEDLGRCFVRTAGRRFVAYDESRERPGISASSTHPKLALEFADEASRRWAFPLSRRAPLAMCPDCKKQVTGALRQRGSRVEVPFDATGAVSPTGTERMLFARRSDALWFASRRTGPCPNDQRSGETPERDLRVHRRPLVEALTDWEATLVWSAALTLRRRAAERVKAIRRPTDDEIAGLGLPQMHAGRYDTAFLTKYMVIVDALCEKLMGPTMRSLPDCVAEEMALARIIATAQMESELFDEEVDGIEALWSTLFWDFDFAWLFQVDGLKLLTSTAIRDTLDLTPLAFHEWFVPFEGRSVPPSVVGAKRALPARVHTAILRAEPDPWPPRPAV